MFLRDSSYLIFVVDYYHYLTFLRLPPMDLLQVIACRRGLG